MAPHKFPSWPRWVYSLAKGAALVLDQTELDALGPGWDARPGEVPRATVEASLQNDRNRAAYVRQLKHLRELQSTEKS